MLHKTLFDLESVRLRYKLTQHQAYLKDNTKPPISQDDLNILEQFALKFNLLDANGQFDHVKMDKYLRF
jgi:hypothetical protein